MGAILLSAAAVFVSTSIDYLLILTIVFAQTKSRKGMLHIIGGQYLGTALLVAGSLVIAFVLHFVPEEWMLGLLGLIPIGLGIRAAVKRANEDEQEEAEEVGEKLERAKANRLFWTITLITLASGGDNLGIYIPYFTSLGTAGIVTALAVFAVLTLLLCFIGYRLASIRLIANTLEKYERVIVPVVFIGLGLYILAESGTLAKLAEVFRNL